MQTRHAIFLERVLLDTGRLVKRTKRLDGLHLASFIQQILKDFIAPIPVLLPPHLQLPGQPSGHVIAIHVELVQNGDDFPLDLERRDRPRERPEAHHVHLRERAFVNMVLTPLIQLESVVIGEVHIQRLVSNFQARTCDFRFENRRFEN